MKKMIVLIGAIREGEVPNCGETMKNQLFIKRFRELFDEVKTIDTINWQKRPFVLIKALVYLLFYRNAYFILSASVSIRHLINLLYYFPINRNVYFWVVGEGLSKGIDTGLYKVKALNKLNKILIQGQSMVEELKHRGITNAMYVPNSKPIIFHPEIKPKIDDEFRFVFLSRIHPDKGIGEITEAVNYLKSKGYHKFSVDFYGNITPHYKETFDSIISENNNLEYKGFLNFLTQDAYKTLSSYDVMIFPTYWAGEAFPGVVIDANIAGLPIIASDWNQNKYVVENGKTGVLIPPHSPEALAEQMEAFMNGKYNLLEMKKNCIEYVKQYDYRKVLSPELFQRIGISQ